MGIRIFTKRGYELSIIEQQAAVLLAHGLTIEEIGKQLGIDAPYPVCRAAKIKMQQSFGYDALDRLRMIQIGSVMTIFLAVFILFSDGDYARGRPCKLRLRRRDEITTLI